MNVYITFKDILDGNKIQLSNILKSAIKLFFNNTIIFIKKLYDIENKIDF